MGELLRGRVGGWLTRFVLTGLICAASQLPRALGELVKARFAEGTQHGYLAVRSESGKRIGTGELVQVAEGDRVRVRLVYRFLDGSIDDEVAVFTQKGTLRLLTDHHIQKGPSFPHPYNVTIDMTKHEVTTREDRNGQMAVETKAMDLPEDLANGLILTLLKNIEADGAPVQVSYVAAMPRPRLVKLTITADGDDEFRVGSLRHKARCFVIKVQLGGITGMVAPLVGKQPGDIRVWIEEGEAPAFIREEGAFYPGGPVWISEMTNPTWGSGRGGKLAQDAK